MNVINKIVTVLCVVVLMPSFVFANDDAPSDSINKKDAKALKLPAVTTNLLEAPVSRITSENKTLQRKVNELTTENEKLNKQIDVLNNVQEELCKKLSFVMTDALYRPFNKGLYEEMILPLITSVKKSELYAIVKEAVTLSENQVTDMQSLIKLLVETNGKFSYALEDMNVDSGKEFLKKLKESDCYVRYTATLPDEWKQTFLGQKMVFLINEFSAPTKEHSQKKFDDLKEELQKLL